MSFYDVDLHNFEVSAMTLNTTAYELGGKCPRASVEEALEGLVWALQEYDTAEGMNFLAYLCAEASLLALRGDVDELDHQGVLINSEFQREVWGRE